jgi:iron-sulfur-dependent L-serine dehydratase beta subunit
MNFLSIFDVIGPNMIGPSSSHTAGAVSIALMARKLFSEEIKEVTFKAHLHCASCVKKVQENIAFEKGVKDLKVSLADQTIAIRYDASKTSEQVLKAAIQKLGIPVSEK